MSKNSVLSIQSSQIVQMSEIGFCERLKCEQVTLYMATTILAVERYSTVVILWIFDASITCVAQEPTQEPVTEVRRG